MNFIFLRTFSLQIYQIEFLNFSKRYIGTMAYLCGYEFIKNKLIQSRSDKDGSTNIPEFAAYFVAGMLAETFACIIYVPVDVIKERLQVQRTNVQSGVEQKYLYNGSFDALKTIMKQEGLQGIYKGYSATLASYGPYSALYFLFYERMKGFSSWYVQRNTIEESRTGAELPFLHTVACSATAGAISSFLTSPLDMAKLRLQIQRGNHVVGGGGDQPLSGMMDCLSKIYKDGGVKGLFRGAGARVAHFVPATTIMMTCYEEFRSIFNKF